MTEVAPEWRTHDYGCLNLEARCPGDPSRLVIIPQALGKFEWDTHTQNLTCTCCRKWVNPRSITRFMVNNVTWGYKGTKANGTTVADRGRADDIQSVSALDGQTAWSTLIFATTAPVGQFECYFCKNQCRVDNCYLIKGKEFCGPCAKQVQSKLLAARGQQQAASNEPAPVLEHVKLDTNEKNAAEAARKRRLLALKQQKANQSGGRIFEDLPQAFTPKGGAAVESHIQNLDAHNQHIRDTAASYDSNYNTVPNSQQGMKRGGPPAPGGGGGEMKRGGPAPGMARGGPPPPGPGAVPKKQYTKGQDLHTESHYESNDEPAVPQPKVALSDLQGVNLKASPGPSKGAPQHSSSQQQPSELTTVKLKQPKPISAPAPRPQQTSTPESENELANFKLKSTPRSNQPQANKPPPKPEEPQQMVKLKSTPRSNNNQGTNKPALLQGEPVNEMTTIKLKPTPQKDDPASSSGTGASKARPGSALHGSLTQYTTMAGYTEPGAATPAPPEPEKPKLQKLESVPQPKIADFVCHKPAYAVQEREDQIDRRILCHPDGTRDEYHGSTFIRKLDPDEESFPGEKEAARLNKEREEAETREKERIKKEKDERWEQADKEIKEALESMGTSPEAPSKPPKPEPAEPVKQTRPVGAHHGALNQFTTLAGYTESHEPDDQAISLSSPKSSGTGAKNRPSSALHGSLTQYTTMAGFTEPGTPEPQFNQHDLPVPVPAENFLKPRQSQIIRDQEEAEFGRAIAEFENSQTPEELAAMEAEFEAMRSQSNEVHLDDQGIDDLLGQIDGFGGDQNNWGDLNMSIEELLGPAAPFDGPSTITDEMLDSFAEWQDM